MDSACGDDAQLRVQIEGLLKSHEEAGSFLEQPLFDSAVTADQPPITEKLGTEVGPYKLLEQIGEGGMGVIYMAQQTEPVERRVALKIIKPGTDMRPGSGKATTASGCETSREDALGLRSAPITNGW